jgi:pumilio homology domain family member 6
LIARSKKLWERLRRKSHVPKDERRKLVEELFEIITGRVKDFVFKHDAVRVIQTALKYARPEQRRQIAKELQGEYRVLAESKYAKFLVAKLVDGHAEIRDMVVEEFYGHVKRLIRHPEASWIVDDIYRTIATSLQKACMLREWYGPEFVIFKSSNTHDTPAELSLILERNPEKRGPIMQHLRDMTNQLVQKKTTGYTMLHDALLQYFLNCKPGSPEANEFLEMLKDDEEGDCYKNLAFTESGSKLTCLALAYGTAKDRRSIMRFFNGVIKMLAADQYGHLVLLTAYEVIDDTVMTAKAIFPELLGKALEQEQRDADLLLQVGNLTARKPLLYLFDTAPPHWLLFQGSSHLQAEVRDIRSTTSKKDPETRRAELVRAMSQPLLDFICRQVGDLTKSGFGCQFLSEVILGSEGDKSAALEAVAEWAKENMETSEIPGSGRMLKTLIHDGRYDKTTKDVRLIESPLGFSDLLYEKTEGRMTSWATGSNSFVVVAFLEAKRFTKKDQLVAELEKNRSFLEGAAQMGNSGAKIILQRLDER